MQNVYIYADYDQSNLKLFEFVYQTKGLQFVGSSNDPVKVVLSMFSQNKPHMIFVDAGINGNSAMNLFGILRSSVHIIFLTSFKFYSKEFFEENKLHYITKHYEHSKLLESIDRVNAISSIKVQLNTNKPLNEDHFFIKCDAKGKWIRIDIHDIFFIESNQNYVTIHHKQDKHLTYLTLKEVENALPSDRFVRIHKSYIVNNRKINSVESHYITLDNEAKIPIGNTYKEQFMHMLNAKTLRSGRMNIICLIINLTLTFLQPLVELEYCLPLSAIYG